MEKRLKILEERAERMNIEDNRKEMWERANKDRNDKEKKIKRLTE